MNNRSCDALLTLSPLRNTSALVGGHFGAIDEVFQSQHSNSSQGCAAATVTKQQGTLRAQGTDSRVTALLQAESPSSSAPPPPVHIHTNTFLHWKLPRHADRSHSKLLLEAVLFPVT